MAYNIKQLIPANKELENMTMDEYLSYHPECQMDTIEQSVANLEEAKALFYKIHGKEASCNENTNVSLLRERSNIDMGAVGREVGRQMNLLPEAESSFEKKHDRRELQKYQQTLL